MGEASKIEWTDHTSLRRLVRAPEIQPVRMDGVVTRPAEGDAVFYVEPPGIIGGEVANMVRIEIATPVVSAVRAGKFVPDKHVIAPSLKYVGMTKASTFCALAVNIAGRLFATRRSGTSRGAYLSPRCKRMLFAYPVARPRLRGSTHLGAALLRHALTLHWRDEGCAPFKPALSDSVTAGVDHG